MLRHLARPVTGAECHSPGVTRGRVRGHPWLRRARQRPQVLPANADSTRRTSRRHAEYCHPLVSILVSRRPGTMQGRSSTSSRARTKAPRGIRRFLPSAGSPPHRMPPRQASALRDMTHPLARSPSRKRGATEALCVHISGPTQMLEPPRSHQSTVGWRHRSATSTAQPVGGCGALERPYCSGARPLVAPARRFSMAVAAANTTTLAVTI